MVCGYHGLVMGGDGRCVEHAGPARRGFPTIRSLSGRSSATASSGSGRATSAQADPAQAASPAVGREPRVGLRRRAVPHQLRLPADDRQPDGPDARDLRPRHQHRPDRDRGGRAGDARSKATRSITSRFMDEHHARRRSGATALRGNRLADDVPVDRWQICRFTPPSHVMIEVGVAHAGKGGYDAPAEREGLEHRGRLHHPRNRDLDLVLLGHGAQLQRRRTRR